MMDNLKMKREVGQGSSLIWGKICWRPSPWEGSSLFGKSKLETNSSSVDLTAMLVSMECRSGGMW